MSGFHSISYVSAAAVPADERVLGSILREARGHNARDEITGILLFHRDRFIQVLEGPEPAVHATFERIANDPRHRSVQVLADDRINARQFSEWTMGFRPLDDSDIASAPGFDTFFTNSSGAARLARADSASQQFLEWLVEYWFGGT